VKLSAQEEYGLRCLLRLARHGPAASLTIPEISQAEGISVPNAAKLLRILRREGFVESARGQHGGYALARPAASIRVAEVLDALGGRLYDPAFCDHHAGSEESCTHSAVACSVRTLWDRVQRAVDEAVGGLTLEGLLTQGHHPEIGQAAASGLLRIADPA
jgi:Rrf2 family protein